MSAWFLRYACLVLVVSAYVLSPRVAVADDGPSFKCSATNGPIEKAVCEDPYLVQLDRQLNDTYVALLASFGREEPKRRLITEQRNWLRAREIDCGSAPLNLPRRIHSGDLVGCLRDDYLAQTSGLDSLLTSQHNEETAVDTGSVPFPAVRYPFTPRLELNDDHAACASLERAVQLDFRSSHRRPMYRFAGADIPLANAYFFELDHTVAIPLEGKARVRFLAHRFEGTLSGQEIFSVRLSPPGAAVGSLPTAAGDSLADMTSGWPMILQQRTSGTDPFPFVFLNGETYLLWDDEQPNYKGPLLTRRPSPPLPKGDVALYRLQVDGKLTPSCLVKAEASVPISPQLAPFVRIIDGVNRANRPEEPEPDCHLQPFASGMFRCYQEAQYPENLKSWLLYSAIIRPWELMRRSGDLHTAAESLRTWGASARAEQAKRLATFLPAAADALAAEYRTKFGLEDDQARVAANAALVNILAFLLR